MTYRISGSITLDFTDKEVDIYDPDEVSSWVTEEVRGQIRGSCWSDAITNIDVDITNIEGGEKVALVEIRVTAHARVRYNPDEDNPDRWLEDAAEAIVRDDANATWDARVMDYDTGDDPDGAEYDIQDGTPVNQQQEDAENLRRLNQRLAEEIQKMKGEAEARVAQNAG